MKKLLLALFAAAAALTSFGQGLRTNVTLYWEYPASELTNVTFIIRGSPTASVPWTNWTVRAVLPGNTNNPTSTNLIVALVPQEYFFICQASNFWGLADPSNVASTPRPPRSDVSLGLR